MGPVHKQVIRLRDQGKDRLSHRLQGGLQDIELIDVCGGHNPDAHSGRLSMDDVKGLLSGLGRHLFGILDPLERPSVREYHGRRDNRAGQGPATGLVNASDEPIARRPEQSFMKKRICL
jgi:hypothetical protein